MGAYTRKDKAEVDETLAMVYKRFPRLEERKNQLAGTLSGGEQQMLAMGRALMSHPKIILKALSIADRAYVLETGKIVLDGDAKALMDDDSIKKAYLGE